MASQADVHNLRVVELVSERAREARRVPQQPEWAPALTLPQFLEREAGLANHPFSLKGMRTWILINVGDEEAAARPTFGEDADEVNSVALSSLETFRQEAVGAGGVLGSAYAIASVFTEPHKRGKGYASILLKGVLEKLREVDPEVLAAELFSDVGAAIYERSGFVAPFANVTVHILRLAADRGAEERARKAAERATWLSRGECAGVVKRLEAEAKVKLTEIGDVIVLPSPDQVDWHHERERIVGQAVGKSALPANGAVCGEACAVWFVDFSKASAPFTRILLFKGGEEEDTAVVVAAVVSSAIEARCMGKDGGVWLWGDSGVLGRWPPAASKLAEAGVTFEEKPRVGYLPMMAPLHPSMDPLKWRYVPQALWV